MIRMMCERCELKFKYNPKNENRNPTSSKRNGTVNCPRCKQVNPKPKGA